jgi:hypothetical protein
VLPFGFVIGLFQPFLAVAILQLPEKAVDLVVN